MEICIHQVQYNGLCAVCGTLIESPDDIGLTHINMGYDTTGLTVSRSEAERLEVENTERLLKDRKLSLILDLDQTLLHASWNQHLGDWVKENKRDDIKQLNMPGSSLVYYIKLRPGLIKFLDEVDKMYELHIYTMGTREYASAVANELDPEGTLFKERILSRDESGSVTQKKLHRLFPCDTSMVVVLDDRSDVWSCSPNLIRIKAYDYFMGVGDIHSTKDVVNTTDINSEQQISADKDNELSTMLNILKEIHHTFYTSLDSSMKADVTHIIPSMKRKVLTHVVLVFADVIPPMNDPTTSWIWQIAVSFGATCSMDLTGKTTHLIATKYGSKVRAAKEYGHSIHIVTPSWLLDTTARWAIQDETMYPLVDDEASQEEYSTSKDTETEGEELIENIDWDEANKEVEEFINESGIDDIWDTDSDALIDKPLAELHRKWKRKRDKTESGLESGDGSEEEDNASILRMGKARIAKRGKSHLSKVTTAPSSQCTSGNSSDNENSDTSSFDEFAGELDEVID
ncbi:hypothetical protein BDB01DRAFT_853091 [Pilobolus umbonatus]|nr:hypothetical protein BDB01DRAFT_853091 [Pilobolus umbonatus]